MMNALLPHLPKQLLLFLSAVVMSSHAAQVATQPSEEQRQTIMPQAAVLEIVPPPWIRSADDPDPLWQKLIQKHATLLADPSLAREAALKPVAEASPLRKHEGAVAALQKAMRVRVVPGTALIEVRLDTSFFAPEEREALTKLLVDVYVENHRRRIDDELQEASEPLSFELKRLTARTDEIARALREEAAGKAGRGAAPERVELLRRDLAHFRERMKDLQARLDELNGRAEAGHGEVRLIRLPMGTEARKGDVHEIQN